MKHIHTHRQILGAHDVDTLNASFRKLKDAWKLVEYRHELEQGVMNEREVKWVIVDRDGVPSSRARRHPGRSARAKGAWCGGGAAAGDVRT